MPVWKTAQDVLENCHRIRAIGDIPQRERIPRHGHFMEVSEECPQDGLFEVRRDNEVAVVGLSRTDELDHGMAKKAPTTGTQHQRRNADETAVVFRRQEQQLTPGLKCVPPAFYPLICEERFVGGVGMDQCIPVRSAYVAQRLFLVNGYQYDLLCLPVCLWKIGDGDHSP